MFTAHYLQHYRSNALTLFMAFSLYCLLLVNGGLND